MLDYDPRASVATRLMLGLFSVWEGAKLKEVVETFKSQLLPEFWPALLMLAGRMQKEALEECARSPSEVCVDAVAATVGNHEAVERLRSEIEREVPEGHHLLGKAEGRTLVEAPAPEYSWAQLAFMSPAAKEGRADAVRLHGLWGFARSKRRLFLAVYENCGNLNGEMRFTRTRLCRSLYAAASSAGRGRQTANVAVPAF